MATFTDAEITSLCEILETNSDGLKNKLDFYADLITDADKAAVLAKVELWNGGIGSNFTAIMPVGENFGAKIDPNHQRQQLQRQIAKLLYCDELLGGTASGQIRLVRG